MIEQVSDKLTLEDITQCKKEILAELREQQLTMNDTARSIFAPVAAATNKVDSVMRSFNTGMAIFDGVMLGLKMMRNLRSYFRRKRY